MSNIAGSDKTPERRESTYDTLVSLRGIFAVCIILFHVSGSFGRVHEKLLGFAYDWGGYFGNCYFFFVSGFLMVHAYRDKISSNTMNFKSYMVKRITRIYPLYIITNIVAFIYCCCVNGFASYFKPKDIIEIVLMICSGWADDIYPWNIPGWFLSMLMLCYITFFFVAKQYKKNESHYYLSVLIFVFAGYILVTRWLNYPFLYNHDGAGIFPFFTGMLFYDIFEKTSALKQQKKAGICLCGGILLLLLAVMSFRYGFQNTVQEIHIVMTAFIFPLLVFWGLYCKPFRKILLYKPVFWWGKISFSLCMWHYPLILIYSSARNQNVFLQNLNMSVQLMLYFVILTAVGITSHFLIECNGWKMIYRRRKQ